MNFLKKYKSHIWTSILILFFSVLYVYNVKLETNWVGGDSYPFFITTDFWGKYLYSWAANAGAGGVTAASGLVVFTPIVYLIEFLKFIFGNIWAQYIYNYMFFILIPISFYYFTGIFKKLDTKERVVLSIFAGLNFLIWFKLRRNILYINTYLIVLPLISRFFYEYIFEKKNQYIWYIFLISPLVAISSKNPAYYAVIVIFLVLFCVWMWTRKKIDFKKLALGFFLMNIFVPITLGSQLVMLKYNTALVEDEWNNEVLIGERVEKEKTESILVNSIRFLFSGTDNTWGYENDKRFYPYPVAKNLNNNIYIIFSFLPLAIILVGLVKNKKNKNYLFWLLSFLGLIFIAKSSAPPLGGIYEYIINNIPIAGIFRSPQDKFSVIIVMVTIILTSYTLVKTENKLFKNTLLVLILIYSFLFSSHYFQKEMLPTDVSFNDFPDEYYEATEYINSDNEIQRVMPLPVNISTWVFTDYGYEGYNLFEYLLPEKQIYSRNSTAFSEYNNEFYNRIATPFSNKDPDLVYNLSSMNIDTIIYDEHWDRESRFKIEENHKENLEYLDSLSGLTLANKFGEISIYKVDRDLINGQIYSNGGQLSYKKINPTKYIVNIQNLEGDTNLSFLDAFDKNWKIYLNKEEPLECEEYIKIGNSNKCVSNWSFWENENIYFPCKKSLFNENHSLKDCYANQWTIDINEVKNNFSTDYYTKNLDGTININLTIYFEPQSYNYLSLLGNIILFLATCILLLFYRKKINE